jgi:hypothetical protein
MAATAAALFFCAVGLVATTIVLTTGNRFEFRPPSSETSRLDDELVRSFDVLQSMATKRAAIPPQTRGSGVAASANEVSAPAAEKPGTPRKRRIVMRLKSPWCTGPLGRQSFYRCRTQSW